jgi:hypothetical protein
MDIFSQIQQKYEEIGLDPRRCDIINFLNMSKKSDKKYKNVDITTILKNIPIISSTKLLSERTLNKRCREKKIDKRDTLSIVEFYLIEWKITENEKKQGIGLLGTILNVLLCLIKNKIIDIDIGDVDALVENLNTYEQKLNKWIQNADLTFGIAKTSDNNYMIIGLKYNICIITEEIGLFVLSDCFSYYDLNVCEAIFNVLENGSLENISTVLNGVTFNGIVIPHGISIKYGKICHDKLEFNMLIYMDILFTLIIISTIIGKFMVLPIDDIDINILNLLPILNGPILLIACTIIEYLENIEEITNLNVLQIPEHIIRSSILYDNYDQINYECYCEYENF